MLLFVAFAIGVDVYATESTVRLKYDAQTAPNGLVFQMLVDKHLALPVSTVGEASSGIDPVELLWSQMNVIQLPNGSSSFPAVPKYSKEHAAEMLKYFRELQKRADARIHEITRVVACPDDRARPSGSDAYLAVEVINDVIVVVWEQLRQSAAAERGPVIQEMLDNWRASLAMGARSHHIGKLKRWQDDPNGMLNEWCYRRGLG